jgi:prevent-host-death family protein
MHDTVEISELRDRLQEVLDLAAAGQEVVLVEHGMPRVRLVPVVGCLPRTPGLHAGAMQPAGDFDGPLPDEFWAGQS